MRKVLAAAAIVLALVASTAAATFLLTRPAPTPPDWTYANCALWENGNTPNLPAYTYTDRCYDSIHKTIAYSNPSDH